METGKATPPSPGSAGELKLPTLQNGVLALGDLWDARSGSRPGFNIFGSTFTGPEAPLAFKPAGGATVKLFHNSETGKTRNKLSMDAELWVDLLGGIVKITGGLGFALGFGHSFDTESIIWHCNLTTHDVEPDTQEMKALRGRVDKLVFRKLEAGEIRATHFVSCVTLGADATASINIRQTNKNSKYRVGAFLKGEIDLILVKAELKAGAELSDEVQSSNYELIIKLGSGVAVRSPPTDLDGFKRLQQDLQAEMAKAVYFKDAEGESKPGVPKHFVLRPIGELLGVSEHKGLLPARAPPDPEFIDLLNRLRDYMAPDFYKRAILQRRPPLFRIMADLEHEVTQKVAEEERALSNAASDFNRRIHSSYAACILKPEKWDAEMADLLTQFRQEPLFEAAQMKTPVLGWIEEGDAHLSLVRIDHDDQTSPVLLFSNADELEAWLCTDRTVKAVLYCPTLEGVQRGGRGRRNQAPPDRLSQIGNFPRALQKLSGRLRDFGAQVAVAFPSACTHTAAEGDPLRFEFKSAGGRCKTYEGPLQIGFAIGVLEALLCHTEDGKLPTRVQLYNVYAAQLGISLPIPRPGATASLADVRIEDTPQLAEFLQLCTSHVTVYEDVNAFVGGANEKSCARWRFVATIETLHSVKDSLHAMELVRRHQAATQASATRKEIQLVICNFPQIHLNDAPLLFLFEGARLRALCVNTLDVLLLLHEFFGVEGDWVPKASLLTPSACTRFPLGPLPRLQFAEEVCKLFNVKIDVRMGDAATWRARLSPLGTKVGQALELAACLLHEPRRQLVSFPTALLNIFAQSLAEQAPTSAARFQELLRSCPKWWSCTREQVVLAKDTWQLMLTDLTTKFLQVEHEYLGLLLTALQFLNAAAVDPDSEPPPDTQPEAEPETKPPPLEQASGEEDEPSAPDENKDSDTPLEEVGKKDEGTLDLHQVLDRISKSKECSPELRNAILSSLDARDQHPRVKATFLASYVQQEVASVLRCPLGNKESAGPDWRAGAVNAFTHLRQLLHLLEGLRSGDSLKRETLEALVTQFTLSLIKNLGNGGLEEQESRAELVKALSTRSYYSLVSSLAALTLPPTEMMLVKALQQVTDLEAVEQIVAMLQTIHNHFRATGASVTLEADFLAHLWLNPKFRSLMLRHVGDPLVLNALVAFQCTRKAGVVPKYIPKPFVAPLKSLLAEVELPEAEACTDDAFCNWNWPTLHDAVNAWQTIWASGSLPPHFPTLLLKNVLRNPGLRSELQGAIDAKVSGWDEAEGLFTKAWDRNTLVEAIEAGLRWTAPDSFHTSSSVEPEKLRVDCTGTGPEPKEEWPILSTLNPDPVSLDVSETALEASLGVAQLVETVTVKGLKRQFLPLSETVSLDEVEAHWRGSPSFAEALIRFVRLLTLEAEQVEQVGASAQGEGLTHLKEALARLSTDTKDDSLLRKQRRRILDLLSVAAVTEHAELLEALQRTDGVLEHEHTLSIPQLALQLLHIHRFAPHVLPSHHGVAVPSLLAHALLRGATIDLPTNATQPIGQRDEVWYAQFMKELDNHVGKFFVVSVLKSASEECGCLHERLFRPNVAHIQPAPIPLPSPGGLRLRVVRLSEELTNEVKCAPGMTPLEADTEGGFEVLLLVEGPSLVANEFLRLEEEESTPSTEARRRLASVLLATSHLVLFVDGDGATSPKKAEMLQMPLLARLTLPVQVNHLDLPPPNVVFLRGNDCERLLEEVELLSTKYPLEAGVQSTPSSTFTLLRTRLELKEATHDVDVNTSLGLRSLETRILREVHATIVNHSGYTLRSWADLVSGTWVQFQNSPILRHPNVASARAHFDLTRQLQSLRSAISKAVAFHAQGYVQIIHEAVSQTGPAQEHGATAPPAAVAGAAMMGRCTAPLKGVYQSCGLGSAGGPCAYCSAVSDLETQLLAPSTEGRTRGEEGIKRFIATTLDQTLETVRQRMTVVLSCTELDSKHTRDQLRGEYEQERVDALAHGFEFQWNQFLSTKNVLVGSWRRFHEEASSLYPHAFMTRFGLTPHKPPTADPATQWLEELRHAAASDVFGGPLTTTTKADLSWEQLRTLSTGLAELPAQLLRPDNYTADGLLYRLGMVGLLREEIDALLALLAAADTSHTLEPHFVWSVHHVGLRLLWARVLEVEADWTSRYNPLNHVQSEHDP